MSNNSTSVSTGSQHSQSRFSKFSVNVGTCYFIMVYNTVFVCLLAMTHKCILLTQTLIC